MENVLETIANNLEKGFIDYLGIFTPIILSCVAIMISMWNSFWSRKIKCLEANMVWDDLVCSFFLLIRNTGKQTLVIKKIVLFVEDIKGGEELELGARDNVWGWKQQKGFIKENESIVIKPVYGSIYDVFGYRGHFFEVDDNNKDYIVKIKVLDIDDKQWEFTTPFTLGEVDEKLEYSVTVNEQLRFL